MTDPISINQEGDQGTQHLPDVNATSREAEKKPKLREVREVRAGSSSEQNPLAKTVFPLGRTRVIKHSILFCDFKFHAVQPPHLTEEETEIFRD